MPLLVSILGWTGTFLVVIAYFLVSYKKLSPTSSTYQFLNLFGVIGVGVSVWYVEAWSELTLQVIWGTIALMSLIKVAQNT